MGAALTLGERGRGRTAPNPTVGCILVRDGRVVGRGWTQPGGRPHAEAVALVQAGEKARDATAYVTLEPCAHASSRGPACADLLVRAGVARVVAGLRDPDPRVDGQGLEWLRAAGIAVTTGVREAEARRAMTGFLIRRADGRPSVTLKLGLSLDGAIATADGRSRWITGPEARAHAHLERSRHEAILVGRGTWDADAPALDVRLPGLEARSPRRVVLSGRHSRESGGSSRDGSGTSWGRGDDGRGGVVRLARPADIAALRDVDHLLVEGGFGAAAAFLQYDLVDRLLLYRAPILIGGGRTLPGIGLHDLADAHGRWRLVDERRLGADRLEVYERRRKGS